jgi:EpsI family protein
MTTRKLTVLLASLAFLLCYAGVIATLAATWALNYAYSYGIAVLLVSAYILWVNRSRLRMLPTEPDYLFGVPVTLVGLGLLAAGRLALVSSLQELSLVVTIAGLVLLLRGRKTFGVIQFPLTYALLGIPIWDAAISWLQPPSQVLSARIGTGLMQLIGIPLLREGTRIVLPNVVLEVMRECSGVNQLLAIVAMALPAAYLWLVSNGRRAALVALAVVFAYVSNGVRIALVGFLAYRGLGDGNLRGVHLFEGLAISAMGYLLLFGCLSLLAKGEPAADPGPAPIDNLPVAASGQRRLALEMATVGFMVAIGLLQVLFRPAEIRLRGDLSVLPNRIGDWTLETQPTPITGPFPAIDDALVRAYPTVTGERHFTDVDDELVRAYRNKDGQQIRLYIGYHRSQREGKELTGEAGHALNAAAAPVEVKVGSETVELGQVLHGLPHRTRGVLYWYDVNGRVFSNLYLAKKYMVWDELTRARTNGAVVMVAWESSDHADAESSRTKAADFAQALLRVLPEFIPS